jgi:hypothetical protein
MSSTLKFYKNDELNALKLGVLYIPSNIPSNPDSSNYLINEYFLKVVDTIVEQLSINEILLVSIPINIPYSIDDLDELAKKNIYSILSKYTDITYFITSLSSNQIIILQEVYFKFNKKKTLLSTGSAKTTGLKFNDNIIKFLPSDYTLVNFISNYYFHETNIYYDCIFIGSSYPEYNIFPNINQLDETIGYINDYLNLTNRKLVINPIITNNNNNLNINETIESIKKTLDSKTNPDYYTSNFHSNYIIQYIQNSFYIDSSQSQKDEFKQWLKDYPEIHITNWRAFEGYMLPDMSIDTSKLAIIYHFMIYITFFDYTKNKNILLFMSSTEFAPFLSIITYLIPQFENIFNKSGILSNFLKKSRILFPNSLNLQEMTSELFNDTRTDTLWYTIGKTWMDLLHLYNPMIFFPRFDQSINILVNKLSLKLNMYSSTNKYIDLTRNSPVLLIPIYNAIQFVYHFYKNGININNFTLNYFLKSTLLYFGNNLIFDENMDNVYNIIIGTSYFNSINSIINKSLTINRAISFELNLELDGNYSYPEEYILPIIYYPLDDKTNWMTFYNNFTQVYNNSTIRKKISIINNSLLTSPYKLVIINNSIEYIYNLKVNIKIDENKNRIFEIFKYIYTSESNPFMSGSFLTIPTRSP